ncbi:DUF4129 domain-containing transglutaminase family protein [Paenibacillus chitinolyticus]|uniref:DUF4129 domain-containing transglutaminase family protein n=1 Tax=Paenibacillus chitinolyticus TaxID=79263 RepID=UPI0035581D7B
MRSIWNVIRFMAGEDGTKKWMALFVLLFLFQFTGWISREDGLWLPETLKAVNWTLITVCATFFIPRIHHLVRELLQIVLVLVVHAIVLQYRFVPMSQMDGPMEWFQANVSQLFPYLWFGLAAWWVFLMAMWASRSKLWISFIVILAILFFGVRDSFSTLQLWPQVAAVIFSGLCMLVVRHLSQLKNKAPESWKRLSDNPGPLIVPVVLIIALTLTLGALVPAVDPVLTDPYTAWRQYNGEAVTFLPSSDDSGRTMVQDPNDPLLKSSGYSRNDAQLGGQFQYDYTPVFTVDTTSRTYYRGETRALYTGSGWEASPADRRARQTSVDSSGKLPADTGIDMTKLKTEEVKQTVKMRSNEAYPVLFGAYPMSKVDIQEEGPDGTRSDPAQLGSLRWSARQAELRFNAKSNYPKQYELVSNIPLLDLSGLKKVDMSRLNRSEWNDYLQLPDRLPERVTDLAKEVTKEAPSAYEKVHELELYLSSKYPYTNTPDVSKGKSKDFVDRFLFEIQEGYCDYYSSAMVVMTRSLGIPARWVKGYASGSSDNSRPAGIGNLRGGMSDPDAEGTYTVRNSDAHSWVEVYFEGYGWLPFEPTAGFSLPQSYAPETSAATEMPTPAPAETKTAQAKSGAAPWVRYVLYTLSGLVLLTAAAVTAIRLSSGKKLLPLLGRDPKAANYAQGVIQEVNRLLRYGRRKGYERFEHETFREAASRWMTQSYWLAGELSPVLAMFEKAKYSRSSVTEQDLEAVQGHVKRLREQMK